MLRLFFSTLAAVAFVACSGERSAPTTPPPTSGSPVVAAAPTPVPAPTPTPTPAAARKLTLTYFTITG